MTIRPIQIAAAAITAAAGVYAGRPALAALLAGYAFTFVDGSSGRPEGRYAPGFHALVARVAWARALSPWADLALDDEAACRAVAGRQVILACHPHGVMSYCHALLYAHPTALALFPVARRRALGASPLFAVPLLRDFLLACGAIDAGRAAAKRALGAGHSLTVLPGGEREQLEARAGRDEAYVRSRKGFCRLAVEFGAPVLPCFAFGESDLYHTSSALLGARRALAAAAYVALPLPCGDCWWNPLRTRRGVRLTVVVGAPLVPGPDETAESLHARYIDALVALHEKHKARYYRDDRVLVVK